MRVAIVGATGNIGTSLVEALARDGAVDEIVGIARRVPRWRPAKVEWKAADITRDPLGPLFAGSDAVVHLAWAIQPSRDAALLRATNVGGSERVLRAASQANVKSVLYASSVGAYSAGPKDRRVDESWPVHGIASSFYSAHKAEVEAMLDRFEAEHPHIRIVRMRPGLIMKAEAADEIRRLFAGPFVPTFAVRHSLLPVVPRIPGLKVQLVHSLDVGEAFRLALSSDARGAFNLAADPVIDADLISSALGRPSFPLRAQLARRLTEISWQLRLQPTPPGWLDMALAVPLLDSTRAQRELGWAPAHDGLDAAAEMLSAMGKGEGHSTPPLESRAGGVGRWRELATGIGARDH